MNEEDQGYFAAIEARKRVGEIGDQLAELSERGFRVPLRGDAGWVAANAFGVVIDVRLDQANIRLLAEHALAGYVVDAIRASVTEARRVRHELLSRVEEQF